MAHPPLDQAQVLRRRLEETTRDLAAARAGFGQTAGRDLLARSGAEPYWIYPDGSAVWTEGCEAYFHP